VPCGKHSLPGCKQLPTEIGAALQQARGQEVGWCPQHLGRAQRQTVTPDQLLWGILAPFEMIAPWQGLCMIKKHLRRVTGKEEGRTEPSGHHAFKDTRRAAWQSS